MRVAFLHAQRVLIIPCLLPEIDFFSCALNHAHIPWIPLLFTAEKNNSFVSFFFIIFNFHMSDCLHVSIIVGRENQSRSPTSWRPQRPCVRHCLVSAQRQRDRFRQWRLCRQGMASTRPWIIQVTSKHYFAYLYINFLKFYFCFQW